MALQTLRMTFSCRSLFPPRSWLRFLLHSRSHFWGCWPMTRVPPTSVIRLASMASASAVSISVFVWTAPNSQFVR